MHHHIRITPDRRSKMRIIIECQTVMTDIIRRVFRLLHGSYGYSLNQILLRLALYLIKQGIDTFRDLTLLTVCLEAIAETTDKGGKILHLFRIWQFMDTIDKRLLRFSFRRTTDKFGNCPVGQQHKLFNQLVGFFRNLEIYADRLSILINFELHFIPVEIDGSVLKPFLP